MRGILLFKLAIRNVGRNKGRTALTLSSIVFGVVGLILSGGFVIDTIREVGESTIHSSSGHLQINRKGYSRHGSQNPQNYIIDQPDQLRDDLLRSPLVRDVALRISFSGLVSNSRADWSVIVEGIEPRREARIGSYITIARGRRMTDADRYGAFIGQGVAHALRLEPGDSITLLASTAGGAANAIELNVVGIFQTFSNDYDARAIRISLAAARELMNTRGAHTAVVLLNSTDDTEVVATAVRDKLNGSGFEVMTWTELNDFYTQTVALYQQQFGFLIVIVLIMMLLSVSNMINLGVFERVGEFGTMRSLGNRVRSVFVLIVCEGLALGVLGAILGISIGIPLAMAISAIGIPMPPPPNADLEYTAHIVISPALTTLACSTGICAAVLASLLPARTLSRMDVAEALRQTR